ncbi:MAG: TIGR01777 family oxidoreductase [Bermanella sp.]
MNILISGASGLIGSALRPYLESKGHQVYILHRGRNDGGFFWQPEKGLIHLDNDIQLDAVINLNGVNIGDKPWNAQRKRDIIESRVKCTQLLTQAVAERFNSPSVFINASAIGFYGDTGNRSVNESSTAGDNFLSEIVSKWEAAAKPVIDVGIRTVFLRSGVVLTPQGGALQKMLLPFKLGLGGKVGSGQQFMSWISLRDELRAIHFLLNQTHINGPVNLCAPHPVTNTQFTKALGKALKRPTLMPMPAWLIKTMFGEMGELLLLKGAKVIPNVLLENGFKFLHPDIKSALLFELGKSLQK